MFQKFEECVLNVKTLIYPIFAYFRFGSLGWTYCSMKLVSMGLLSKSLMATANEKKKKTHGNIEFISIKK